jgi:hypothetical protein
MAESFLSLKKIFFLGVWFCAVCLIYKDDIYNKIFIFKYGKDQLKQNIYEDFIEKCKDETIVLTKKYCKYSKQLASSRLRILEILETINPITESLMNETDSKELKEKLKIFIKFLVKISDNQDQIKRIYSWIVYAQSNA